MKVYERHENNFTYPEDMKLILDYLKAHGKVLVKDSTIEDLYYGFSEEKYCAGWMCVDEQMLEEFEDWLNELEL
jgi:hypothetical protein